MTDDTEQSEFFTRSFTDSSVSDTGDQAARSEQQQSPSTDQYRSNARLPDSSLLDVPLLNEIDNPPQLRKRRVNELPQICAELRQTLIEQVSVSGGHFGAGLGVIELTVALHFTFNTPADQLLWDVGHQAYPHKLLTGRRSQMSGIRTLHGLAGFPVREESPYDAFGVGHAGTSISAGLGMAAAFMQEKQINKVVCVIGDGAMTEGMAFEALNHAGAIKSDAEAAQPNMLVILNDNDMSISPNVGALTTTAREGRMKAFFETLGCHYHGPVCGHDVTRLVRRLKKIKDLNGIHVLHVKTVKGKGYQPAENDQVKYHAVSPFDPSTGVGTDVKPKLKKSPLTYTSVFSQWLCDTAAVDERVVAITPAMREGSGLVEFEKRYPNRYHDVGMAEQHAVTFAAGLACRQAKPVVAIYSSFLQRAYDQLIHDVALQRLNVLFAIDRSGLVGADGATHHGSFDISYLRCIPNLVVMAPANERECRQMLQTGLQHTGPAAVRYERGSGPGVVPNTDLTTLPLGKGSVERQGSQIAILAFGSLLEPALAAAQALDATVVNMRFIKPLDEALLTALSCTHSLFITVENNAIAGGAGSAVNEAINRLRVNTPLLNLGLPDEFINHGSQSELMATLKLDADGIAEQVKEYCARALPHCSASKIPTITPLDECHAGLVQTH